MTRIHAISMICGNRSARLIGGSEANFWRLTCATFFLAIWAYTFGKGLSGGRIVVSPDPAAESSRPRSDAQQATSASEFLPREEDGLIDVGIAFQKRRPFGINEPAQSRFRPAAFDQRDSG